MKLLKICIIVVISLLVLTGCNQKNNDINMIGDELLMKININNVEYIVKLDNNETTQELLKLLPIEFDMNELNGNEKYQSLPKKLPTNAYIPDLINQGDVMLYGSDTLVIFYSSFSTRYSYTKIGHIDNLPDLGSENVHVIISK